MQLKVQSSENRNDALSNIVRHNKTDIPHEIVYLAIGSITYKSLSSSTTNIGSLSISGIIRSKLNLAIGDIVEVNILPSVQKKFAANIKLTIANFKAREKISIVNEGEISGAIVRYFKDYCLLSGQFLLFEKDGIIYTLNILEADGYVNPDTKFQIISLDYKLNLVSSESTKPKLNCELFKPDFDFKSIGIGGLSNELKEIFKQSLSLRAIDPQVLKKLGLKCLKGILLYGPPGCGKTLIARNISSLISPIVPKIINGPEILNKYVGQSEENIRNIFLAAQNDSDDGKSDIHVIIFDEIDSICRNRGSTISPVSDNIVNQILCILDGVNDNLNNIFIIAMTNRKDLLDPALLRAGRLEVHIEISLPDHIGRCEILQVHMDKIKLNGMIDNKNINIDELAAATQNFTGAELSAVIRNAVSDTANSILATGNTVDTKLIKLSNENFIKAIAEIKPMFGRDISSINTNILPKPFFHYNADIEAIHNKLVSSFESNNGIKSVIIYGKPKSGKTILLTNIASKLETNFCKYLKGIDTVNINFEKKLNLISEIFSNAYQSQNNLIILDDVETIMEYSELGNVSFSVKMYHFLLNIIKADNVTNSIKLFIIFACNKINLFNNIKESFDTSYQIDS